MKLERTESKGLELKPAIGWVKSIVLIIVRLWISELSAIHITSNLLGPITINSTVCNTDSNLLTYLSTNCCFPLNYIT